MNSCIVNEQGELLEILQEGQEKELEEGQSIVPLSNFYDVLNLERFDSAIWSFEQEKWIGQGEQRPEPLPPQPTPEEMVIAEMSMSMAQMQAESNQSIAELTTVIAMLQIPMV